MKTKLLVATMIFSIAITPANARDAPPTPLVVRTSDELLAALSKAHVGQTIRVERGRYIMSQPIVVPDGVELAGEGVMNFDPEGIPSGFEPGTETRLEAAAEMTGDLVSLANGSRLRGLTLVDQSPSSAGRLGNAVSVASRSPGDVVESSIIECAIFSSNRQFRSEEGPTGRGIAVFTRNPSGLPRRPHEGASVHVRVERSIVRNASPSGALFLINFASNTTAGATLIRNRIEGTLVASAAANRPETVSHATTRIESDHNVFHFPKGTTSVKGWALVAASSMPYAATDAAGPSFNTLRMRSSGDRIEGFSTGIAAAAARRYLANSGTLSDNMLDLSIGGLRLETQGIDAADLQLFATISAPDVEHGSEFVVGDRNVARIRLERVIGSGPRANAYALHQGPAQPANYGEANRLEIVGNANGFTHSNPRIEPAPPAELFTDSR